MLRRYTCLPRPPTAQASLNAAAVPRVSSAVKRALEKPSTYKSPKIVIDKRWPSTRPPAATRATPPPPQTDRRTAATAASTPTPARSRRPASPKRHPPPAGDGRGRRLHWELRAHHLRQGSVQRERVLKWSRFKAGEAGVLKREAARKNTNVQAVRENTKGKARGNRHLFYEKGIIHDA